MIIENHFHYYIIVKTVSKISGYKHLNQPLFGSPLCCRKIWYFLLPEWAQVHWHAQRKGLLIGNQHDPEKYASFSLDYYKSRIRIFYVLTGLLIWISIVPEYVGRICQMLLRASSLAPTWHSFPCQFDFYLVSIFLCPF